MRLRLLSALSAASIALVAGSLSALAGGWAVTSVDSAPDQIVAGHTYSVEYTIRQHGDKPVAVDDTFIQITSEATGETLQFPGQTTDTIGQYSADVRFPAEGGWRWQVSQGLFGMQDLGRLEASAPASGSIWSATTRLALVAASLLALTLLTWQAASLMRDRRPPARSFEPAPGVVVGE